MNSEQAHELAAPVLGFLHCPTPKAWLEKAKDNLDILLVDHAHCERKAASTGLNLLARYPDRKELLSAVSQLIREEVLHFEQVSELMEKRGVDFKHLKASDYASSLFKYVRQDEPDRLVDTLIVGAIIEARSCERFFALSDGSWVDEELSQYYRYLLKSESRHFEDYLSLAEQYSGEDISDRCKFFLEKEAGFIQAPCKLYRFHSGIPA